MKELNITTSRKRELVKITSDIEKMVSKSNIKQGIAVIFTPHATAGLLINEDEEGLKSDFEKLFRQLEDVEGLAGGFDHNKIDNNAQAHLTSGLIGSSKTLLIESSQLILGTWQDIFLVELDGPRSKRKVLAHCLRSE